MTALYERYLGCAAFHPTDDNIVFIIGGYNENSNWMKTNFKVHLDDGSHHNLKDLDFTRIYHTCMGFVKKDGRPVSLFFNNVFETEYPMTKSGFLETSLSDEFINIPAQELQI